jgi:AcrR family transcriptional regulator
MLYNITNYSEWINQQSLNECRFFLKGALALNKQPEITERTRQNLIDAFWLLYTQKRIEKITVREVANLAGYNRGTFYEYFRDVYHVLETIEEQSLPTIAEFPPLVDLDQLSPEFITSIVDRYREKFYYYEVLLGDRGDPAFQRQLKDSVKSAVLQALAHKENFNRVEIDLLLEYILSGLIGILIYAFQNRPDLPKEEVVVLLYGQLRDDMVVKLKKLME